jgi:CHAD domain-containing protein
MSFRLEGHKPLGSELRSVLRAEIEAARRDLDEDGLSIDDRVHETRKRIKKLRAGLALVRSEIGRAFEQYDEALREVAHLLAPLRERAALGECLAALEKHASGADLAALTPLIVPQTASPGGDVERLTTAAKQALTEIRHRLKKLSVGDGWHVVAADFEATYKGARKAARRARARPGSQEFHTLRRRAKKHQHQLGLLDAGQPEPIESRRRDLAALGDELGDHHDLGLLEARLAGLELPAALEPARVRLLSEIARLSDELAQSALARSARLFAEPSDRYSERFARYFKARRRDLKARSSKARTHSARP